MPLLEVVGLRKDFGGLQAVQGVDLTVAEGEIVGLIGPNGSGKTTLFNLVTGLLPASGGRVVFGGRDVLGLAGRMRSPGSGWRARSRISACSTR